MVDQRIPDGTDGQVLRSNTIDSLRFESIEISMLKLIEIVILWVHYSIPLVSAHVGTFEHHLTTFLENGH